MSRLAQDLAGNRLCLVWLFVLLALPLGIFAATVIPVGQVVDEQTHAIRADSLLYGDIIGHRKTVTDSNGNLVVQAGVTADAALIAVVTSEVRPVDPHPAPLTDAQFQRSVSQGWSEYPQFVGIYTLAGYMPVFYLPGAVAIGGTRLLGGTPYDAYLAIRLVNLACFVLLGALALNVTRHARGLLFATLLLPMTVNLAASANQDGLLIAAIALAMALMSAAIARAAENARVTATRQYWFAAALMACVCTVKPPYLPLAGMLLLPLPRYGAWRGETRELGWRALGLLLVAIPTLAWMWLLMRHASVPRNLPPYEAGPLWPGSRPAIFTGTDIGAQLQVLMADKLRLFTLEWNDLTGGPDRWQEVIGVLGWLNFKLPSWLYGIWLAGLAGSAASDMLDRPAAGSRNLWDALFLLLAAIATVLTIYWSQYLTWIPVGMPFSSAQGRYFLPLLPFLGLAIAGVIGTRSQVIPRALLLLPVCAASVDLVALPRLLIRFYYLG